MHKKHKSPFAYDIILPNQILHYNNNITACRSLEVTKPVKLRTEVMTYAK